MHKVLRGENESALVHALAICHRPKILYVFLINNKINDKVRLRELENFNDN